MLALALGLLLLAAGPALAEEAPPAPDPAAGEATPGAAPTPKLGLDRLLQVPTGPTYEAPEAPRRGKDREAWEREFEEAREDIVKFEAEIEANKEKLRAREVDDWSYSPTGGGAASDPEVMAIRAQLKRDRASLAAVHRRLRDLEIEASLAGVPDSWIRPSDQPGAPEATGQESP